MYKIALEQLVKNLELNYHNLSPLVREELKNNPKQTISYKNPPPLDEQKESLPGRGEPAVGDYLENKLGQTIYRQHPYLTKETEKDGSIAYHLRQPDYYLPEFELAVEYNGYVRTKKGKERYEEKAKIYQDNGTNYLYVSLDDFSSDRYMQILTDRINLEIAKKEQESKKAIEMVSEPIIHNHREPSLYSKSFEKEKISSEPTLEKLTEVKKQGCFAGIAIIAAIAVSPMFGAAAYALLHALSHYYQN